MTNKINHTSVHTHLEKARGMQPLEFMKVAVYLLCATAAVLVMSLQYHLFRDCPTKLAICVVSSIIVLIGLIFLASRYILKYQLYIEESQSSQLDMAERQTGGSCSCTTTKRMKQSGRLPRRMQMPAGANSKPGKTRTRRNMYFVVNVIRDRVHQFGNVFISSPSLKKKSN